MIEKLSSISRVTEVDAASMRMIGAYLTTPLVKPLNCVSLRTRALGRSNLYPNIY